jgi:hypothetical protein
VLTKGPKKIDINPTTPRAARIDARDRRIKLLDEEKTSAILLLL